MGVKYIAGGKDISGDIVEIQISKDGYVDTPIELKMASSPILRMDNGGRIKGTSLEFSLLSETAGALTELYTTDAFGLKVQLLKNSVVIWTGYVLREQYGEDYIEPPYAINVTATDGLGILKDVTFEEIGAKTTIGLLYLAFNKVFLPLDLIVYSQLSLKVGGFLTRQWLSSASFDCTDFADDYYEMLEKLLETINAYITQRNNKWVIERTPDIGSSGLHFSNGAYVDDISPIMASIKPIGSLALVIEPSKKNIEITSYKNFPDSITTNYLFKDGLTNWDFSTSEFQETTIGTINGESYVSLKSSGGVSFAPYVSQNVQIGKNYTYVLTLDYQTYVGTEWRYGNNFQIQIYNRGYRLSANGWVLDTKYIDVLVNVDDPDVASRQQVEIKFQASPGHVGVLDTYSIKIRGVESDLYPRLVLYKVALKIEAPIEKYLDVTINSNATQDADEYGIHISDEENVPHSLNVWKISGNPTTEWQYITAASTSSFNIMMARDIISNHLITRAKLSGSIEEIGDVYFDTYGSKNYLAESYDYDLLNKIASIELIEFSAFHDIALSPFKEGEYTTGDSSSSSSSSSSGGGGVALGETEFTAYRGDRGKIAYDHSQNVAPHFDAASGAGKITKAQGVGLVANLGDGSTIADQVSTNASNISTNTTDISNINTNLGNYANVNGDITKPFSASQLTTNKIILNGIELTIEAV